MAMHNVYINARTEARLALIAERRECTVEYVIEESVEETAYMYFRGCDDDPARKEATDV